MAEKSPRQHLSKKAGRSLKENAHKRARADAKGRTDIVSPGKKP